MKCSLGISNFLEEISSLPILFSLSLSFVAQLCLTLVTPWTVARQATLSVGSSGQEYWSGLPFPLLHGWQILYWLSYEGSPSHSIVFLCFFSLITEEGFLISPCYSLELRLQMGISSLFSFAFSFFSFLFSAICKASSDSHFAFLHFFFLEMVLITASFTVLQTSIHSFSGTLVYQI